MKNKELKHILQAAIEKEKESYDFYMHLCDMVDDEGAKDTLRYLAGEEKKHRNFLKDYRKGRFGEQALRLTEVIDYEIAQYLEAPDIEKDSESKEVYLVAAHREYNAHTFYKNLANIHPEGEARELLHKMANEELKHKEKVEYLYANTAFPQTAGG